MCGAVATGYIVDMATGFLVTGNHGERESLGLGIQYILCKKRLYEKVPVFHKLKGLLKIAWKVILTSFQIKVLVFNEWNHGSEFKWYQ